MENCKWRSQINVLNSLLDGQPVRLPSLPIIALKIIDAVKSEDFSTRELAAAISADPALAAKTLKLANSAFYSQDTNVDSIEKAVILLGNEALKNIALSFVVVQDYKNEDKGFNYDTFWRSSITAAVTSDTLCKKIGRKGREEAFTMSLLMDIGQIVMYSCRPTEYKQVLKESDITDVDLVEIERTVFGYDHQEVGMQLLKDWGIPASIYMPIGFHHSPRGCPPEYIESTQLLRIARIASLLYNSDNTSDAADNLKRILMDKYEFTEDDVTTFIDTIAERTLEQLSTFDVDSGEMKPYSQILQEANQELINLNMSYEQLVVKLRESNERKKNLARELKSVNQKLRALVYRDPLTGLYNHRFFFNMINKEVKRAERYAESFSLIIFHIDRFIEL
ncbi:MAG: HDOD domain-containing protein, partial [Thermodesulfobacteriota bacterium]